MHGKGSNNSEGEIIDFEIIKKELTGFARLIEYDENRVILGIYEG